ncbi:MAG: dihydrolipoyl dehydrogenase [Methylacidiphilales bacterium]|nr:dihydrolipoyl dehydrogenase [Candidatus Methylacidiphilales bacterium]
MTSLQGIKEYDVVVIGGGSGGYAAARSAVAFGARTAVIEGGTQVGGLCILRGCMPTKALLESAHRLQAIRRAGEFGLSASKPSANWKKIIARKNRLIEDFAGHRRGQLEKGNFDFIRGMASFVDANTLEIRLKGGGKKIVRGKTFVLATGSEVAVRDIPGLRETGFITSDEAIHLDKPLKSIAVLGGGAVALEFAQYFHHLGVKTTLIQRSRQVLRSQDADLAGVLTDVFAKEGMKVHLDTELVKIEKSGKGKKVVFRKGGKLMSVEVQEILYALGRRPAIAALGLEKAGVKIEQGAVKISRTMQSSRSHIFAAGDVCGPYEVVHTAIAQGETAARNAVRLLKGEGEKRLEKMDYRLKMEVVFTEPELAAIGMSEKEAAQAGRVVRVAKYPFNDHGKSMIMGAEDGFVKIIADAKKGEILGAQIVGPHASDLIHEFAVAMHYRATVGEFLKIPHYHPTLAEIVTYPAEEIAQEM